MWATDPRAARPIVPRREVSGVGRKAAAALATAHVARGRGYGAGLWCDSNAPRRVTGRRALGHQAAAGRSGREGWAPVACTSIATMPIRRGPLLAFQKTIFGVRRDRLV